MKRFKLVKIASLLGIVGNLFLCIIKSLVGFVTGSQAMIADAFNSAGDILSSLITYIGNKIASKPKDDDHNLGHGKAEYIYSMLISIVMIIASFTIFKESLVSLLENKEYTFSIWLVVVCIVTIIIKISLYLYTNYIARKEHNLLISANSKDHFYDSIITFLNLISCLLSLKNIY